MKNGVADRLAKAVAVDMGVPSFQCFHCGEAYGTEQECLDHLDKALDGHAVPRIYITEDK